MTRPAELVRSVNAHLARAGRVVGPEGLHFACKIKSIPVSNLQNPLLSIQWLRRRCQTL